MAKNKSNTAQPHINGSFWSFKRPSRAELQIERITIKDGVVTEAKVEFSDVPKIALAKFFQILLLEENQTIDKAASND